MPSPPEISIVVPTFNEIDNLTAVIENVADAPGGTSWEIIFVDDDSPDGTAERAKQLSRGDLRIRRALQRDQQMIECSRELRASNRDGSGWTDLHLRIMAIRRVDGARK